MNEQPTKDKPITLGVVSIILSVLGFIPGLGFFLALIGFVLGLVGLLAKQTKKSLAIAGIIISILAAGFNATLFYFGLQQAAKMQEQMMKDGTYQKMVNAQAEALKDIEKKEEPTNNKQLPTNN